jgi:hypothetical protein
VTHAGLLVLLVGGFVIRLYAREFSLTLQEGEGSNVATARQAWEVAVWTSGEPPPTGEPPRRVRAVSAAASDRFAPGDTVFFNGPGLKLEVESYFRNAEPLGEAGQGDEPAPLNSSGIRALRERPPEKEPSANLAGGIFLVGPPDGAAKRVLLHGVDRRPTRLELGEASYDIVLRRKRQPLPFTVVLNDFQREMHPGSNMARSYASEVTVLAGETSRRARIAMNEPLRYRGFTLFQSSYREMAGGQEFSTFAVVRNRGRYLPYAGTFIVFAGLLVHFVIVVYDKRAKAS